MSCPARRHGTDYANRKLGCVCPDALAARRAMRPAKVRGRSGPGRRTPGRSESWIVSERVAATRRLTLAGESAAAIALRLGVAERTVSRYRAQLRKQP